MLRINEVEATSNEVANALLRRLAHDESPVALLFDHDLALAVVTLGVIKAGKPLLVLDPTAGPAAHELSLAESSARLLIADEAHLTAALALAGPSLTAVRDTALVEGAPSTPPVLPMAAALSDSDDAPSPAVNGAVVLRRHGIDLRREGGEVVQVQAGDPQRPPLFVAHDIDGAAYRYRSLGVALGDEQPLYAFESPFLEGHRLPIESIGTLAERYVHEMRRVQPLGPYHVAGHSFGGILAFEIARRLERDGQDVALLGVIDVGPGSYGTEYSRRRPPPSPWVGVRPPADPEWPLLRRAKYYGSLAKRTPRALARHLAKRTRLDHLMLPIQWELDLRRQGRIRPGQRCWYSWQQLWQLTARDWEPSRYDGDLTLFWAQGTGSVDATMGWGDWVTGTLIVRPLGVSHAAVLADEHVGALGRALRAALDDAAERHEAPVPS